MLHLAMRVASWCWVKVVRGCLGPGLEAGDQSPGGSC